MTPFLPKKGHFMTNEVQHVKSRCGGGKTQNTLKFLYPFLTENPNEKVIISSKTNKLTAQSHKDFTEIHDRVSDKNISFQRIDIDTVPRSSSVWKALDARLDQKAGGVIFVSHAALKTVDPKKLRDVRLIFDEVPSELVRHVRVSYEYKDAGSSWETLIKKEPCQGTVYQKVTLDDSGATVEDVQRRIKNIRSGIDNNSSRSVADLLEFLLTGHEVMYSTSQHRNGKVMNYYLATDWQQFENLVTHSKHMAILSSQVHDTLVGFIIEKVMSTQIVETLVDPDVLLENQHTAPAVIYPLVEADLWSSNLKGSNANERLSFNGQTVTSSQTVGLYSQEIAHRILQGKPTLLVTNKKEDEHECWQGYPCESITSSVHGQNSYTGYDNAVYLSSNRPDQMEINALKLFAQHHNQCPDEIIQTVLTERCHETAYQCIARTSVRNLNTGSEKKHIFVVPDEAHAKYIAKLFKQDMATTDRTYLHQLRKTTASEKRDKQMFNLIVQIRTEYLAGSKLKDLKRKYGVDDKKYQRYVNKFRPALEQAGLLNRKQVKPTEQKA
jgi:hypothetical protein